MQVQIQEDIKNQEETNMEKKLKPYFSAAIKKLGSPEKLGLPSQKTIMKSAYMSKCGKKK